MLFLRKSVVGMLVLAGMLMPGCATLGIGADTTQVAMQKSKAFCAALAAEDLSTVSGMISEHFSHYDWHDKAGVMAFLAQAKKDGDLQGMEYDLDDAEVRLHNRRANVYPIDLKGKFGKVTIELVFRREWKHWRIIKLRATGL